MMHEVNSRRGIVATTLLAIAALTHVATAQVQPPPSAADAIAAFSQIEVWLQEWSVPSDSAPGVFVQATAASVELRLDGAIIGRGSSAEAPTCLNAARHAMEEAFSRLPIRNDALLKQNLIEHAKRASVSVELAGDFVPARSGTMAELDAEIQTGIEGVAVRIGTRQETMFPSTMLSTNTSAGTAASILIRKLRPDVLPFVVDKSEGLTPNDLISDGSAIVYKFRTIHVAQPAPGRAAAVLTRGGRVVELSQINSAGIAEMASQMARNLIARQWPFGEALGMVGTIHPVTGRSEPLIANAYEQAMAATALRRFARTVGVNPREAADAEAAALEILTNLAAVEVNEIEPWRNAASSAMCVIAATQGGRPQGAGFGGADLFEKCSATVRAAFNPETGFSAQLPAAARGDVSLALVRLAIESGEPEALSIAERAIRQSLIDAGPGGLPMLMPWIGFAEVELAGKEIIPSSIALRDAREMVWDHQMTPADVDDDTRDLIGGIVFTSTGDLLPSWHSARPVAFFAMMLGDDRLTEANERGSQIIKMVRAMRFLRQLMADAYSSYRYANPAKAVGGVRSSLWDDRMPVPATALSLLAACEMLDSLDKMSRPGP